MACWSTDSTVVPLPPSTGAAVETTPRRILLNKSRTREEVLSSPCASSKKSELDSDGVSGTAFVSSARVRIYARRGAWPSCNVACKAIKVSRPARESRASKGLASGSGLVSRVVSSAG